MADKKVDRWLPLEEAAAVMNRNLRIIKSQMRNGRIQRDRHFRRVGEGQFELNVTEYLEWLNEEKERRKLPFIERVRLSCEDHQRNLEEIGAMLPKPDPSTKATATKRRPKLIPVGVLAEETFGEYAPCANTLRNWVKNGLIYPMPARVGNRHFCSPDAEYFDPVVQKIRRMTGAR
ncbi:hypothetical protein RI103_14070 [Paraburkholderia sp. FT54]|uniref:hypothetical protein n=1 Tax=Paraburkholderia sp. FT54 TaxID=3074437 RepID=UPI002877E5D7|nr:hypothetical protein [Paraburkholderia sp. FT54]WNC88825.1 hypothetical protein RI103_14070 [Paraburkholderia sp. FT54]